MAERKPKKVRRSYSCGPCKSLKTKCDLNTPCASCVKFKRADKCIAAPPQPPSEEEKIKAEERRQRLRQRKERSKLEHCSRHCPSSLASKHHKPLNLDQNSTHSPSASLHPPQFYGHVYSLGSRSPTSQSIQFNPLLSQKYVAGTDDHPIHLSPSHPYTLPQTGLQPSISRNSLPNSPNMNPLNASSNLHQKFFLQSSQSFHLKPGALDTYIPYQFENTLPSVHSVPCIPAHTTKNFVRNPAIKLNSQTAVPRAPTTSSRVLNTEHPGIREPVYAESRSNSTSLNVSFKSNLKPLLHKTEMPKPKSENLINQVPSAIIGKCLADSHMTPTVELSRYDVQEALALLPTPSRVHYLFTLFIKSEHSVARHYYDSTSLINAYSAELLAFKSHGPIPKSAVRVITLVLAITATGELFADNSDIYLSESRFICARRIRESLRTGSEIDDVIFSIQFYFAIENYCKWTEHLKDNYLEYNRLLSDILYSEKFMNLIRDQEVKEDSLALRLWLRVPSLPIDYVFFETKGTLLSTAKLKDILLPHRNAVNTLFPNSTSKKDLCGYTLNVWSVYFKRSISKNKIQDVIRSYLFLYKDIYELTVKEARDGERKFASGQKPTVSSSDILSMLRNQIGMVLFVRWLSFIRIEKPYFPSLRFASFLTSVTTLFNYFLAISNNCDIVERMIQEHGYHIFKTYMFGIVYQALFLVILSSFVKKNSSILDLELIFKKVKADLFNVRKILMNNSQFQNSMIKLPFVSSGIVHSQILMDMTSQLEENPSENFDELTEFLDAKLVGESWNNLVSTQFGSKDAFIRYSRKIYDLFVYLTTVKSNIKITHDLFLDQDLINNSLDKFSGMNLTSELVQQYIEDVVIPKLEEFNPAVKLE